MTFAFLIMGKYDEDDKRAEIGGGFASIIGVADLDEAVETAKVLQKEGVGCIELCGAFGPEGAKAIIDATENKIPVGYITHLPEQDELYARIFGGK